MYGIEKKNNRYQITEGVLDFIKVMITGKGKNITKISDSDLSPAGKQLKKATIAYKKEIEKKAKAAGMSPEEYSKQRIAKLGIKL
jgi:hypothetical protein